MVNRFAIISVVVAVLGLQSACAPRLQELGPAAATGFIAPHIEVDRFITRDGQHLGLTTWQAGEPQAIIIALHGMGDYSNAFALPGPWWAEHGISTYAIDQRGFGRSPQRGIWPGSDLMVQDLEDLVAVVRAIHPALPVYVLGHSMGGAVVIAAHGDGNLDVEGTILVAPAVWGWSSIRFPLGPMLWMTAHLTPGATATGSSLERWPTDNIELLRANGADELMIRETRMDAVYGLVGLMERGYTQADQVSGPVLVLYGGNDQIIPPKPVTHAVREMCSSRRVGIYEDGYHMLLRDLAGEIVWRDILSFVQDDAAALPSGADSVGFLQHPCGSP